MLILITSPNISRFFISKQLSFFILYIFPNNKQIIYCKKSNYSLVNFFIQLSIEI